MPSKPIPGSSGEVLTELPSAYQPHLSTGLLHLPRFIAKTVHRVNHVSEWEHVQKDWEVHNGQEILCLQSMMFLTEKQRGIGWFYHLLQPIERIMGAIQEYTQRVRWEHGAYNWVGVHVRRTDLRLKCNTDDCLDGLKAEDVLPLSEYTSLLEQVIKMSKNSGRSLRFYLATDDAGTEARLRNDLRRVGNLTQGTTKCFRRIIYTHMVLRTHDSWARFYE